MKNIWILFLALVFNAQLLQAQFNFKQHKVEKGEDIYSIAKEYGTTPEAIYNLNPTAKQGIQPNTFIVLPNTVKAPEHPVEGIVFKKHKTKRKEAIYSISKKYGVTIEDIKKYNPFLEDEPLRKGDILKIPLTAPKVKRVVRKITVVRKPTIEKTTQIYTVQAKETRYGIARKFGITIPELENMNPNLGTDFPVGIQILVPSKITDNSLNLNQKFKLYEVRPKETLYSLTKRFEISSDSLEILNPAIKEGLKSGMILRLPSLNNLNLEEGNTEVNLENKVNHTGVKTITVMLPFGTKDIDFNDEEQIKTHLNNSKVLRLTVDFYTGILLAVEQAKNKGISVNLDVYDTQKNKAVISSLIAEKNISKSDAIIGPLYKNNIEKAAQLLNLTKTPVFSPISNKVKPIYSNLFQTIPSSSVLEDEIISFVKRDSIQKKIIIIADEKNKGIKAKLIATFKEAEVLNPEKEGNFIVEDELIEVIGEEPSKKPIWVFLESSNMQLVSNVIPFLNARAKTHQITLFTTNKSHVYKGETVSNTHLSNLNFHYPSVNKEVNRSDYSTVYNNYKSKYGVQPSSYAMRGYDLTYDLLLRLASSNNDLYNQLQENFVTEYNENKFNYVKSSKGGFINNACYIIKHSEGLQFKVVQ